MAAIAPTSACLRFFGDDLNPDEVTELLGGRPTRSARKGEERAGAGNGRYVEKSGSWLFEAAEQLSGDLDSQIRWIFTALTADISAWAELSRRFQADIFCGLFMLNRSEGLELSPEILQAMGQRGLRLSLDIYDPSRD